MKISEIFFGKALVRYKRKRKNRSPDENAKDTLIINNTFNKKNFWLQTLAVMKYLKQLQLCLYNMQCTA